MPSWDPETYLRFADERARPFHDLTARVGANDPELVVDLGCGPATLTATLAQRWARATVVGVDGSPAMVEAAAAVPGVRVELGDARTWTPHRPVDVLVTNALLQWVPHHLELLPRWVGWLAPGGWLALQVPGNVAAPSHALMRQVAASPEFAGRLEGVLREDPVHDAVRYAEALADAGCVVDAWETTYVHVLDPAGEHGDDAVLEWMQGTGLRPVLDALADDPEARDAYVARYAALLRKAYPRRAWGTPLPFRRVFAVGRRV
ncbi:MAG: trans-aconitate 2-methyltransferase [Actinomycetes bacterium]